MGASNFFAGVTAMAITLGAALGGITTAHAAAGHAPTVIANARTVVSLTFDDGWEGQADAGKVLDRHGVRGTFFVSSGVIGRPGYLTRTQLRQLSSAGHEIGGHSVSHPDLVTLDSEELARQICKDRSTLLSWGFKVRSFAYPFARTNEQVERQAQSCGYNSARMLGGLESRSDCKGCGFAEAIPPSNPFHTRALNQHDASWTLQDLQDAVARAEQVGGWLQLTFHHVCDVSCGELSITTKQLDEFVGWLTARSGSGGTIVATVGDVIGGEVRPVADPRGLLPVPLAPGVNGVRNAGLEESTDGQLRCWSQSAFGRHDSRFTVSTAGRNGSRSSTITVNSHVSGDAKLLQAFDLGSCAPSVAAGRQYSLRAWYSSTAPTQFTVYLRNRSGAWSYWTSSPQFGRSSSFAQAVWTTPRIPPGANGISFGLGLASDGTLTTDDYELYDSVGAPPVNLPGAPPKRGVNAVKNPALEQTDDGGAMRCWSTYSYGKNRVKWSVTEGEDGGRASTVTITHHSDGDAKLLPTLSLSDCAPGVKPGRTYSLRASYKSSAPVQFVVYRRLTTGEWKYWTASPHLHPSERFERAEWTTPEVPKGTDAISFGLSLFSKGALTTDDYAMFDSLGAPRP
ncbi:polysaccharide deacetylase family protein [Ruicaihuangia caeni]|uniref:polysaccharide deacetylase family protein n=1 Tax=Ruicaihuangia caeni TaxID=3042517 RepID=UPI0033906623